MNRITEPDSIQLEFSALFPEIVLASQSENRRALLERGGTTVHQIPTDTDEKRIGSSPEEAVLNIARAKMRAYLSSSGKMSHLPALSADTLVLFEDSLIGKAKNEDEAKRTIKLFSGKKQMVISAALLYIPEKEMIEVVDTVIVQFKKLSDAQIDDYIASGDWIGAAGSYRLQRNGWSIIERIEGDWTTVVGLPLRKLIIATKKALK